MIRVEILIGRAWSTFYMLAAMRQRVALAMQQRAALAMQQRVEYIHGNPCRVVRL